MSETNVDLQSVYMTHSGGSKFYELSAFWNPETSRGVLVRRWGKLEVAKNPGGGEMKKETFTTERELRLANDNLLNQKKKRGYSVSKAKFGIHWLNGDNTWWSFEKDIRDHFGGQMMDSIRQNLSGGAALSLNEEDVFPIMKKAEPARSQDWGSW